MRSSYLKNIKQQFEYYKLLGDKTFEQLTDDDIYWQYNEESNSIAIIVKHIVGNMLSRWTDFLTSDGEKEWRHRDAEFENPPKTKTELLEVWEKGWKCLFNTINSLGEKDLDAIIYIRNQGHTVLEAINRQICHYPYHIGQLVYIAKMIKNDDWKTLSVARNKSSEYNKEKFNLKKVRKHFTEDL